MAATCCTCKKGPAERAIDQGKHDLLVVLAGQEESPTGKARYGISLSAVNFTLDARAAQSWVFLADGFSSFMTIPSGGCRAPS